LQWVSTKRFREALIKSVFRKCDSVLTVGITLS